MKVILWMGMSLNGMIARRDNEEDFISHQTWEDWLGWIKKNNGCLVWGRKTYEIVRTWPEEYFNDIKDFRKVIVTSNKNYKVLDGFSVADSPGKAVEILSAEGFDCLTVTGGSELNSSFAKLGLIDEVVVNVEPVVIGEGIPIFKSDLFDVRLELSEIREVSKGLIQLRYRVLRQ